MTYPERTVGDGAASPCDDDGMFNITFGHVSTPVSAIMVVFHQHINGVVVNVHTLDGERGVASATGVHRELRPLVDSNSSLLQTRASSDHLKEHNKHAAVNIAFSMFSGFILF